MLHCRKFKLYQLNKSISCMIKILFHVCKCHTTVGKKFHKARKIIYLKINELEINRHCLNSHCKKIAAQLAIGPYHN